MIAETKRPPQALSQPTKSPLSNMDSISSNAMASGLRVVGSDESAESSPSGLQNVLTFLLHEVEDMRHIENEDEMDVMRKLMGLSIKEKWNRMSMIAKKEWIASNNARHYDEMKQKHSKKEGNAAT